MSTDIKQLSTSFRILNILLACLQNMTTGGILFGWASISGTLLLSTEGGPALTRAYIHLMYVFASFFSFLGPLLLGIILDMYGPRYCSMISISIVALGCLLFGFSNASNNLYIPAMCLISFGGPGAQNAIIHLSNLFPRWKATATAVITGSFQLSFSIFFIFNYLWLNMSIDCSSLFIGYSMICMMNVILSWLFWPDIPYVFEDQLTSTSTSASTPIKDQKIGSIRLPSRLFRLDNEVISPFSSDISSHGNGSFHGNNGSSSSSSSSSSQMRLLKPSTNRSTSLKYMNLNQQLLSVPYLCMSIFFIVNSYWANFFIGTIDLQLGDSKLFTASEQRQYGSIFTIIMISGIVAIPITGTLMDSLGFPITSLLTTLFGIIWAYSTLLVTKESIIISFIAYSLFRTFLFTYLFAYIADVFGFKYFGILGGLLFVVGGLISLTQYNLALYATGNCHIALAPLCDQGNWKTVNFVMLLTMILSIAYTYQDYARRIMEKSLMTYKNIQSNDNQQYGSLNYREEYG